MKNLAELTFLPPKRDAAIEQQVHVRWDIKTGGGADASSIDAAATTPTAIADLTSVAAPASWPPPGRVAPQETTIWALDATLVGYKLEQDQDYHLVLSDQNQTTLIVEIPDPADVDPSSLFKDQITSARQAFDARFGLQMQALRALAQPGQPAPMIVQVQIPVHVTGIGFFDFIHGQTGVAQNGIELHPVLSIQFTP
jgi:hypothetical protein